MKAIIYIIFLTGILCVSCKEKYYFPNGKISSELVTKKGKKNGKCIYYYSNGRIQQVSYFINDKLHGKSLKYYPNGNLCLEMNFKNDTIDGIYKKYYENGNIAKSGSFIDGIQRGIFKCYYPNGNLKSYDEVYDSISKYVETYDSLGNLLTKLRSADFFFKNDTIDCNSDAVFIFRIYGPKNWKNAKANIQDIVIDTFHLPHTYYVLDTVHLILNSNCSRFELKQNKDGNNDYTVEIIVDGKRIMKYSKGIYVKPCD